MLFIQAKNYRWANRSSIRLVCIHTMENPERPNTAESVARWFAGPNAPMASAHLCVDNIDVVECVKPEHVAFGAPNANADGYHIEHAGRASQTAEEWADSYSGAMLQLSAQKCAEICKAYSIPLLKLSPDDIGAGKRGICGHWDVTVAYRTSGGHTDPGAHFPWAHYISLVEAAYTVLMGLDA